MYFKFLIDGPLEEISRKAWPEASEDDLFRDYENVYEWVWLSIPEHGLRLNISREHEWGEETQIYPIYVQAFHLKKEDYIDRIPKQVIQKFQRNIETRIEIYNGRVNVDNEGGELDSVIE